MQSNLRGSLLEGNEDHLPNQARSDLAKQELHVEHLNKCIGELERQTKEQRLAEVKESPKYSNSNCARNWGN